jgi:hypothetical protein
MEKMEKMEKMDKTASQKKRSQYRKHFLPEKKKAKIQEREKIMRSFEVSMFGVVMLSMTLLFRFEKA